MSDDNAKNVKMAYIDVNYVVNQSKDVQALKLENAQKNSDANVGYKVKKKDA